MMEVTHVLRAEEHLPNTLRQLLVYEALGFQPPKFGHMSLILAPDKSKLSKRHGATSVGEFRQQVRSAVCVQFPQCCACNAVRAMPFKHRSSCVCSLIGCTFTAPVHLHRHTACSVAACSTRAPACTPPGTPATAQEHQRQLHCRADVL
jgi:tRNA synthetases class I (E and Q), catalytic domain